MRKKGFLGRRLGPRQMTTDTAVRVTREVVEHRGNVNAHRLRLTAIVPLASIPYIDNPEIRVNEHESTEMPFRYMTNADGNPIMPAVGMK